MTTPIDTTRLRERTEAARDAGAVMRAAREHSDHALTAASADEYRKAAEAFRAASATLAAARMLRTLARDLEAAELAMLKASAAAQRLAAVLAILRAAVASGDARARVLADVEEVARG